MTLCKEAADEILTLNLQYNNKAVLVIHAKLVKYLANLHSLTVTLPQPS